jgi:hypothetical protein
MAAMNTGGFARKAIQHARPRVIRFIVYCRDLSDPFPDVENPLGVRIDRLDAHEASLAAVELSAYPNMRTLFRRARERNWQAYVARLDGRIVGAAFMTRGFIRCYSRHVHRLSDQERYSAGAYVLPGFRNKKLFHLLKIHSYLDQRDAGVQRIFSMLRAGNAPSLRVHRNLGAQVQFGVLLVHWMFLNFYWRVPAPADGSVFSWVGPAGR